jgi:beta-glucosidase
MENKGVLPVNESVLVFNQDETGRITRPVSKLSRFQKCFLKPGEIKQMELEIPAAELCSFPNEKGEIIIEPGFHVLSVDNQKIRFRISEPGLQFKKNK